MYVLICYDVAENPRRMRVMKLLKGYLERVQKSVFEGRIESDALQNVRDKIQGIINHEMDTVRIYALCGQCQPRTEIIGTGCLPTDEDDWVI